jgi:hypothetical protein
MARKIARDSVAAWEVLCQIGGIEPEGRDIDFEEKLRTSLKPSASTLVEALRASSTDELIREFFRLAQPFVEMFAAILKFFESAGAREGRLQWEIQIEDDHLNLSHFETFLENWNALDYELEVPAIDSIGSSAIMSAAHDLPEFPSVFVFNETPNQSTGLVDVDLWLKAYFRGEYRPYPESIHPAHLRAPLSDAASIAMCSVEIIRKNWPNRATMLREHRAQNYMLDDTDGFSPRTIAQYETDYRLGNDILRIAQCTALDGASRDIFIRALANQYEEYPRRKLGVRATQPDLERILSLPLWKRRHELYAVWVATEIVNALADHNCELHHEGGRITFAFRETVVATVHTSMPKVRLYAERRSPLATPIGPGRKGNVQPDYTLWRGGGSTESCGLVVEVKHYKQDSASGFREVLTDYARAHRNARVVLVNHGPARESYEVEADVSQRCFSIGELTTNNLRARKKLRELIREYVGNPISLPSNCIATHAIIAIDVSGSMSNAIQSSEFFPLLDMLSTSPDRMLALIDTGIRHICTVDTFDSTLRNSPQRGGTNLNGPIRTLLEDHLSILLITDLDGRKDLSELDFNCLGTHRIGNMDIELVEIRR